VLTINDVVVAEGDSGDKQLTFTVSLSQVAPGPVAYRFVTTGGDATAGVDYEAQDLPDQVIPQGQLSKTHSVTVHGDTTEEPTEVILAYLKQPAGASLWDGQGTGYIRNDDGPVLSILDASVAEGQSGAKFMTFRIQSSQPLDRYVYFHASTQDVSATAGNDYSKVEKYVVMGPDAQIGQLQVPIAGDTSVEHNETFLVTLTEPQGASLFDRKAIGTIYNDDGPTLSVSDASVSEGDSGSKVATFTVFLNQPAAAAVNYRIATGDVSATAGSDYVAQALGGQYIPAGQLSKTFTVTINGDTAVEANETFRVTLSNISANATLFRYTGTGTITNDD
jgi:hypothetical protein